MYVPKNRLAWDRTLILSKSFPSATGAFYNSLLHTNQMNKDNKEELKSFSYPTPALR